MGQISAPGDSSVQRVAEVLIREALSARLGMPLDPLPVDMGDGTRVDLDAASPDRSVIAEIWAHQGVPKPAQKAKVMTDALKLLWVGSVRYPAARRILVLADEGAARHFVEGRTWMARALRDLGVEVVVVDLTEEVKLGIREAQAGQIR